jgi:hypothetical protein
MQIFALISALDVSRLVLEQYLLHRAILDLKAAFTTKPLEIGTIVCHD